MPQDLKRRKTIVLILAVIAALVALLLIRCQCKAPAAQTGATPSTAVPTAPAAKPSVSAPAATPLKEAEEILTPAILHGPAEVKAGAAFAVTWTGPNNAGDYVTLVRKGSPDTASGPYGETRQGATLNLTAPIDTGDWELRYVANRSRKILGRAPLTVTPIEATLESAPEVIMGAELAVSWTGPNNAGDYITLVPTDTPDGQYGNYTVTRGGSPLKVKAPIVAGDAELRYMTGQGDKVIARRAVRVIAPEISLSAPTNAIAGATIAVTWIGPNNQGDYITVVPAGTTDGQYGNYTYTKTGSPLSLRLPIPPGEAELRYMAGQGDKVLARRPIRLLPIEASLSAPAEAKVGAPISVTWTGPNYAGDYVTVVPIGTPDGQYRNYTYTKTGAPLNVKAPEAAGDCEIRYMTGQGDKVIARRPIRIAPL